MNDNYEDHTDDERLMDSLAEQHLASIGIIGVDDVPAELMKEANEAARAQLNHRFA